MKLSFYKRDLESASEMRKSSVSSLSSHPDEVLTLPDVIADGGAFSGSIFQRTGKKNKINGFPDSSC